MNAMQSKPFEFKIPAIPEKNERNIIPTGKQIPRTPIKPENKSTKLKEQQDDPLFCMPGGKPVHKTALSMKNCIPRGKEIPRTPIPAIKVLGPSSTSSHTESLSDIDLGVQPLIATDEIEDIDFKIEINILMGKINLRKGRPKERTDDDNAISESKENYEDCEKSNVISKGRKINVKGKKSKKRVIDDSTISESKENNEDCENANVISKGRSHGRAKPSKDSSHNLCAEMEMRCVLVERSELNINNEKVTRRNPERKAKAKVNYKM